MKFSLISFLLLSLGVSSLHAIERPKSLDEEKIKKGSVGEQPQDKVKEKGADAGQPAEVPQVNRPAGAWLGVLTKPVSETLRVHLDVEEGVVLD